MTPTATALRITVPVEVIPPDPVFREFAERALVWVQDPGVGYLPVDGSPYDDAYFEKYAGYATTALGRRLTVLRIELVRRHIPRGEVEVVDIGIGCGDFVERAGESWGDFPAPVFLGYDVNRRAVEWLTDRGLYRDPYAGPFEVATFFDSLEHICDVYRILDNVTGWVFASLPIFRDAGHATASKHFRRDEHVWYFTRDGFIAWMAAHGFVCLEHNTAETLAGREDISSFAFRRAE